MGGTNVCNDSERETKSNKEPLTGAKQVTIHLGLEACLLPLTEFLARVGNGGDVMRSTTSKSYCGDWYSFRSAD